MTNLAEILEQELEEAVEGKNRKSLHRYAVILAENIVQRSAYEQQIKDIRSDIKVLTETMKQGFEAIEKRFEAVDKRFEAVDKRFEDMYNYMNKRFEDMNKRFSMMFTFMNIGFGIIILITILFKFIIQ